MAKTVELILPNNVRVQVEGSEPELVVERGLDDAIERVTQPFEDALDTIRSIADGLQASLRSAISPPDSVTVSFGLNFKAESGVILAKGSVGANLDITMSWKKG